MIQMYSVDSVFFFRRHPWSKSQAHILVPQQVPQRSTKKGSKQVALTQQHRGDPQAKWQCQVAGGSWSTVAVPGAASTRQATNSSQEKSLFHVFVCACFFVLVCVVAAYHLFNLRVCVMCLSSCHAASPGPGAAVTVIRLLQRS